MDTQPRTPDLRAIATAIERLFDAGEKGKAAELARRYATRTTWIADDGNAPVEFDVDDGTEAAEEYVDGGDWGEVAETGWVHVRAWPCYYVVDVCVEDRDADEKHMIELEPEEPECIDEDGHDWRMPVQIVGGIKENPGVQGNGGGVIIDEVCVRCGCRRQTDTWAQCPETGIQGLESVRYDEGYYVEDVLPADVQSATTSLGGHPWLEGECPGLIEAAAYVLLACRGEFPGVSESPLSAIPRQWRADLGAVCSFLERVYFVTGRERKERAMALAVWIAACAHNAPEAYSVANAVRAVMSEGGS